MVKATTKGKKTAAVGTNGAERVKAPAAATEKGQNLKVQITPLLERVVAFKVVGTAPLVVCKFATAKFENMKRAQEAGTQGNSKKVRQPREFKKDFENASHRSREGWYGLPAASFRNGLIETCRMCGFKMTIAKMSVFIEADGYEAQSGDPLVRLKVKEPRMDLRPARNANGGMDIRARPMWDEWSCVVRIRFDEAQFSVTDITNLLHRMGAQNGIGEGRANSTESAGCGWGSFRIDL